MLDQEVGGGAELAAFLEAAVVLNFAKLLYGVLEQTRESGGVEAKFRDLIDSLLGCKRRVGEDGVFHLWDAGEAPGSVGEVLDHGGFGGSSRLVFFEEFCAEGLVFGFALLGIGSDGGAGGEAVAACVLG